MQLGTRWQLGSEPPASLPDAVVSAVRSVEFELSEAAVDCTHWRWTLTWLEGRPVVELDDGTVIRYEPHTGIATISASPQENSPDEG